MLGPLGVGEQVLLISAQQQPPPVGTSPSARQGLERAALGAGGTRRRRKRKVQSSNKTWGGVRRAVQSLTIFLFWEVWEPVKFPVGKKSILGFSREDAGSHLCAEHGSFLFMNWTQTVQLTHSPTSWEHPGLQ